MIAAILVDVKGMIHHEYRNILRRDVNYLDVVQGMAAIWDERLDLVILDCGRKGSESIDMLKRIKEARPDLPVVFVTEASAEEIAIRAYKSGARDYFRKPVDENEFRNSIEMILGFRRVCLDYSNPPAKTGEEGIRGASSSSDVIPGSVLRAVCFIENNLSNPFNLEKIAAEARMSKFHFCRLFKKYLGVSPVRFAINRRLNMAKTLLHREDMHIAAIAARSGFNDLSQFNKQFKKSFGVSPSVYRFSMKERSN